MKIPWPLAYLTRTSQTYDVYVYWHVNPQCRVQSPAWDIPGPNALFVRPDCRNWGKESLTGFVQADFSDLVQDMRIKFAQKGPQAITSTLLPSGHLMTAITRDELLTGQCFAWEYSCFFFTSNWRESISWWSFPVAHCRGWKKKNSSKIWGGCHNLLAVNFTLESVNKPSIQKYHSYWFSYRFSH